MEPTTAELIFYGALGAISLVFLLCAMCAKDDHIEITWGQRRDWERREKEWR